MIRFAADLRRGPFRLRVELATDARVTGLYGPSGSGKTSILLALAGLLRPEAGEIQVNDLLFYSSASGFCLPAPRRRVGVVFQDNRLFPHLNAGQNLLFGYRRTPVDERRLHPHTIVPLLGLEALLHRHISHLSGGELRRLAIGRALLTSPRLLVLDEPLTGLDAELRRAVLAYLLKLRNTLDMRLVYISHTLSDMIALTDAVARIRNGKVEPPVSPETLLAEEDAPDDVGTMETALDGKTVETEPASGTAVVDFESFSLTVRSRDAQVGDDALVVIRAEDVLLMSAKPPPSSARNLLSGEVVHLHRQPGGYLITVDVGRKIYAAVTRGAVDALQLAPGRSVYVLLKARALQSTSISPPHQLGNTSGLRSLLQERRRAD